MLRSACFFISYARCNEPSPEVPAFLSPHTNHSERDWLPDRRYTGSGWPFATSERFSVLFTHNMARQRKGMMWVRSVREQQAKALLCSESKIIPHTYCCTTWILFFFCENDTRLALLFISTLENFRRTFHFSMSSCLVLYCFASSTRTLFMLSAFDCSCGSTSPTVRSTSTPLIMRKHLRVAGSGVRVSRTSLDEGEC